MYKIYCLVDPDTKMPFYVGATKLSLKIRLRLHLHRNDYIIQNETNREGNWYNRNKLIYNLLQQNKKPIICVLFITNKTTAKFMEKRCYEYLQNILNITLLQNDKCFAYSPDRRVSIPIN